jgi:hypothetical protein
VTALHRISCSWLQNRYVFNEHTIQHPLHHIFVRLTNRFHRCLQCVRCQKTDNDAPDSLPVIIHTETRYFYLAHLHEGILLYSIRSAIQIGSPLFSTSPSPMFSKACPSILILALTITANGAAVQTAPVKLSLARHFNLTGTQNVLQHDLARVRHLKARAAGNSFADEPITNQGIIYTASVGVGSPATYCEHYL